MQTSEEGQKPVKVYVQVAAVFTAEGNLLPRSFVWEDGQRYKIERVLDCKPAAAPRAGGHGDRYTVRIDGKERYLYFERSAEPSGNTLGRWFVERKTRQA